MNKKLIGLIMVSLSTSALAITIAPPYIADSYESDEVFQVCGNPMADKSYICSLIDKTSINPKSDSRVIAAEMQIEFAPNAAGTMLGSIVKNQLMTVDCKIDNVSYGSDDTSWTPWVYLAPGTVGHNLMDKICELGKK